MPVFLLSDKWNLQERQISASVGLSSPGSHECTEGDDMCNTHSFFSLHIRVVLSAAGLYSQGRSSSFESSSVSSFFYLHFSLAYNLLDSVCYFHYLYIWFACCSLVFNSQCISSHSNLFFVLNEIQSSCFTKEYLLRPGFICGTIGYFEKYIGYLPTIEYKY